MKKIWNQLYKHLDLVVFMCAQPFHMMIFFPYDNVIIMWIKEKTQGFFGLKPWIMNAKCSLA